MSQGHYIALHHHRVMLEDEVRMSSFRKAILETVMPGDVVVEVGTGTGVLSLWAAQAGASRVYAIDPAPIIGVARRLARDNSRGDCIEFIQADAREVTLPEKADVLISECMGNFFVTDDLSPVLRDAKRFLVDGAKVLPRNITLWVAPIFYPLLDDVTFWDTPVHGLRLEGARWHALRTTYVRHVDRRMVVSEPQTFGSFPIVEAPDSVAGSLSFTVPRRNTVHAFAGWFDAELAQDVTLKTGPGSNTHWAQLIFPVEPVSLEAGSHIDVTLDLAMREDYTCRWRWWGEARDPRGLPVAEFLHDTAERFG